MKNYCLLTLFFLPYMLVAQSNYKMGYVVNLKGDTLRGYINLKEWGHNPENISFKPTLKDKAQQFGLSNIGYFEITDVASYRQYPVSVSLNPVDISAPAASTDTITETRSVFLKVLQKGKNVTLYAYRDNLKERFYIKDNSMAVPVELVFGIYQSEISGNVVSKTLYRVQLSEYVVKYKSGSGKVSVLVQRADYNENDLMKIAAEINGVTQATALLGQPGQRAVRFFVGACLFSNTIKAGQYYGSPSSTSGAPKITAGADLIVNPAVGHLIFRVELAYSSGNYSFNNISNPIYNVNNPQNSVVTFAQRIISVTPQVIFNIYNAEALKIFVDLGYTVDFFSYHGNNGHNLTSDGNPIGFDSTSEYGTSQLKTGLVIAKTLEIYGTYFPSSNINITESYHNYMYSYQVGLSYFFW